MVLIAGVVLLQGAGAYPGHTWTANVAQGTSVNTLGTRDERYATGLGVEMNWPARLSKVPGWESMRFQEFVGANGILTDPFGLGVRGLALAWLDLGFRWIFDSGPDYSPFIEFGSGLVWADRLTTDLSSRFNFGTFMGVGAYLHGFKGSPRAGLRFIHVSNAGTQGSNGGVNLLQFTVGVKL
jgi:hypothetical protein